MTDSGPAAVPATLYEVTAPWLDGALRAGGHPAVAGARVTTVAVEPLGDSVGFLGDLARLRVGYEPGADGGGAAPATMIVKVPASDPGGHQVGSMLRAWAREVAFYTEVAPASPGARVPQCYVATGDDAAKRWVVVLEDCPHEPVDPQTGPTEAQAIAAVDALASFHAAWWDVDTRFEWMPGFDTTGVGGLQGPWLDALPLFRRRYDHLVPEPTGDWIERFAPTLGAWSARVATEPLTVVHADYRLDNLLFAPDDPGRLTMIDWQTALRGPGAMDLTSFCITSLTIDQRRRLEPDLIDRYLAELAGAGVEVDRAWFLRSYDENLLWWMGQFANNLARLEPDDADAQHRLDTMIERTYTAALDHDVGRLLS